MAKLVVMPKLGLTMTEGTVSSWLKAEGEQIQEGEPLFQVETDKLTNTIEAPASGILRRRIAQEGETVACLEPVAIIAGADEDISPLLPGQSAAPAAQADTAPSPAAAAPAAVRAPGERVIASPAAKKLAKDLGIALELIQGTGPKGRITEDDVKNYKPQADVQPSVKASPLAAKVAADIGLDLAELPAKGRVLAADILAHVQSAAAPADSAPREERVAMSGMRKAIAKNMLNSHMTSPTVSFNLGVDVSAVREMRRQLMAGGVKVSYTDILVKILAKALTEFPLLNCSVEDNKIVYKHYVNMGVAVALDNGLVVPNVPDADKKSLTEISAQLKELAALAREGKLGMEQLTGGTFTITNLGMYGIESFTPIINQPEVAILGVNTIQDKALVVDGTVEVRPIMNLSLTADHRVVDGSVAAQFLQRVKQLMENPALLLA